MDLYVAQNYLFIWWLTFKLMSQILDMLMIPSLFKSVQKEMNI